VDEPQPIDILYDILRRVALFDAALNEPDGVLRQALHDILRIYGLTAQLSEVVTQQREQLQALADAMAIFLGRMIEHDRKSTAQHDDVLRLLQSIASGVGMAEIVQQATDARAILQAEALEQHAAIELSAKQARRLLKLAQMDALSLVQQAVDDAKNVIADSADEARDVIQHERDASEQPE
jgi:hypothetical protein